MKQLVVPVAVLLVGTAVAAWFVGTRPEARPQEPQEKIWPVAVRVAEPRDVQPDIIAFGAVRAAREAELRALVAGVLVSLNPAFKDGSYVTAGTPLATIDPVDYENRLAEQRAALDQAAATLAEFERELEWERRLVDNAKRQVELARRALERTEALSKSGRESQKTRDDAEAALATNEQNHLQRVQAIARLESRIKQQRAAHARAQATLAMAERDLAKTQVVAPFDGFVADVTLALGKRVSEGEALGRLLSADELEVRFEIPEADFARLLEAGDGGAAGLAGRSAEVIWRLGDSERRFSATVARLGAEIDPTVGGVELYAALDNGAVDAGLRAGAFVEVRLKDTVYRDVLRLPSRALSEQSFVYVLRDGRLAQVEATVARDVGDDVLVRADIAAGEQVVQRAFAGIGPGLLARPL